MATFRFTILANYFNPLSAALGEIMKYLSLLVFILLPLTGNAFDYSSYEIETLDNIIKRSNVILDEHKDEKGIELISPTIRIAIKDKIMKMPYKCDNGALLKFMSMVGYKADKLPPINYCIDLKSNSGVVVTFHVQDTLVQYLNEEVKVGENITLWALWIYSSGFDGLPRFLANEFEASK